MQSSVNFGIPLNMVLKNLKLHNGQLRQLVLQQLRHIRKGFQKL